MQHTNEVKVCDDWMFVVHLEEWVASHNMHLPTSLTPEFSAFPSNNIILILKYLRSYLVRSTLLRTKEELLSAEHIQFERNDTIN
jgi:hypothetical protein